MPKPNQDIKKCDKIIIIGAGVFGLTTALHLSRRGYTNIHIFDSQPYDKNHYACSAGCTAASCDENKILRASYGDAKLYQDMAFRAMDEWRNWNDIVADMRPDELEAIGLESGVKLWENCGFLRVNGGGGLEESEVKTQEGFPKEARGTQYRVSDPNRRKDAQVDGVPGEKLDPFGRIEKGLQMDGYLDMTAGFVLASRACAFALHLVHKAGVQTHLGPEHSLKHLIRNGDSVTGITIADSTSHAADLVIVACGGWTPSLIPELEDTVETTAGSVLAFRLPDDRKDLWTKYEPNNFPVWSWNMHSYDTPGEDVGGIYGLPRTPEGIVKVAFRGAKWTSYTHTSTASGRKVSYPKTNVDGIPEEAMRVLRTFCAENLPDLLELEPESCRLCWYSDSVDNSFVIDYVPGTRNLVVANGGSGHGFKFLPVLGERVVDVLEGNGTDYTRLFKWRTVSEGSRNGLEEGEEGWRVLERQDMSRPADWRGRRR